MSIVETLVSEKIASNPFHAANMLNVLECGKLATDKERVERCRLYKAWKNTGENKKMARLMAIQGQPAPKQMFDEEQSAWTCPNCKTRMRQDKNICVFCGCDKKERREQTIKELLGGAKSV